jgi:signal transduction histidine kinase
MSPETTRLNSKTGLACVWGLTLAVIAVFILLAWEPENEKSMPLASQGVIDLSDWDMEKDGPVRLDGEWDFYWNQLLGPDSFSEQRDMPTGQIRRLNLPSTWNIEHDGSHTKNTTGVATLRLRVLPGRGNATEPLSLQLFKINAAYTLWVNGQRLAQNGVVGTSEQTESERPSNLLVDLPVTATAAQQPLELLLHVSNFHYRNGGIIAPIRLGPQDTMHAQEKRFICISMFFIGALFIMGAYHIALFFFRPNNISPLYFAAYCLSWMIQIGFSEASHWVYRILFPNLSTHSIYVAQLICMGFSVPIGYAFFRSLFPNEFSRAVQQYAVIAATLFAIVIAATPTLISSWAQVPYYISTVALIAYCLVKLLVAWRRGREAAAFIFGGFVILGIAGTNDMFLKMGLIRSLPLIAPGMFMFMLFQAFALSQRLSWAFASVETLSTQLEQNNLSLKTEIATRERLEKEIVKTSEDERRRISQDLHDGLCQLLTAARLRCATLSRISQKQGIRLELKQLSDLLDNLGDQAYNLSIGLWPLEHGPATVGPSLQDMIRRFSRSSGIFIDFHQDQACESCTNKDIAQLYRIAQEAIANAIKHARPTHIIVTLDCRHNDCARLVVQDNGIGRASAAKSKGGLGMSIMTHRARMIGGNLRVEDAEGGGTVVICSFPCSAEHSTNQHREKQI